MVGVDTTYTVDYTNNGTKDATNVSIEDCLPAGYAFVSSVPAPTSTGACSFDAGRVGLTYDIGNLAPAAMASIVITATPTTDTCDLASTNDASITSDQSPEPNESCGPGESDNQATCDVPPPTYVDLNLTKECPVDPMVGVPTDFTVNFKNNGTKTATNVVIEDCLPLGVEVFVRSALDYLS